MLPLARPDLADQFGVAPPRAVVLLGHPGPGRRPSRRRSRRASTGRSSRSFPRAWPPIRPASPGRCARRSGDRRPGTCGGAHRRGRGKRVASPRRPALAAPGSDQRTAEDHPGVPRAPRPAARVRDQLHPLTRLRVPAPRPLDYVIPIGLPDADARGAIWERYIPAASAGAVDTPRSSRPAMASRAATSSSPPDARHSRHSRPRLPAGRPTLPSAPRRPITSAR